MPERLRKIRRVLRAKPTLEGAGVRLRRVFGNSEVPMFDPFLLLDDFRSDRPADYAAGFPWHPHRGMETITYVLRGSVEHGDSMGNAGRIGAGDVQWMTAGSGIVHQEMPDGDPDGRMHGFQLWANLPAASKMMDPRYQEIRSADVPEVEKDGARIRLVCGSAEGRTGPVRDIVTDPEYLDVTLQAHAEFVRPTPRGHTVFAYVIDGRAIFCKEKTPFSYETEGENYFDFPVDPRIANRSIVLFDDGDRLVVTTQDDPVRFLLISGRPIGEPVAWYGPIVMNTQAELRTAFQEYVDGTFIKAKASD